MVTIVDICVMMYGVVCSAFAVFFEMWMNFVGLYSIIFLGGESEK